MIRMTIDIYCDDEEAVIKALKKNDHKDALLIAKSVVSTAEVETVQAAEAVRVHLAPFKASSRPFSVFGDYPLSELTGYLEGDLGEYTK